MKIMVLMLVMSIFSKLAYSQCELEKKQVDKWNNILKNKVSERARNKHREAKKIFLDLRQPTEKKVQKIRPHTQVLKSRKTTKTKYTFSPHKSSSHITVSNYTNFKGNKKRVWYLYFIESDECLSNKNDMKIFVVCGKVRKQNLKTFSARWNNQTQELMPFLDN